MAAERTKYSEARQLYLKALEELEKEDKPSQGLAWVLKDMADLDSIEGNYKEGEAFAKKSIAVAEKLPPLNELDLADSLHMLGRIYHLKGDFAAAEPLYLKSLSMYERGLGPDHPNLALHIGDLASLYYREGKFDEAEKLCHRCLALTGKAARIDEDRYRSLALALNLVGEVYHAQRKLAQAEEAFTAAAKWWDKLEPIVGRTNPDAACTLNNLADVCAEEGKRVEARALYKRSLAMCQSSIGEAHPSTATVMKNLGSLDVMLGENEEAEMLLQKALKIRGELNQKDKSSLLLLNSLGALYMKERKYDRAELYFTQALDVAEALNNPEQTAQQLSVLYLSYRSQNKLAEARAASERALLIREKDKVGSRMELAANLSNLAEIYSHQNENAKADELYQRAIAEWAQLQPAMARTAYATTLKNYAKLLTNMNQSEKAAEMEASATRILGQVRQDASLNRTAGSNN